MAVVRIIRGLLVAIAIAFLAVTLTPMVHIITLAVEQDWYSGPADVLVVLGGSMLVPGTGPNATLGHDTYLRCVYAAWIWKQQSFHQVVVTGNDGAAEEMARFLEQRGIPQSSIILENRASSTYENAKYTKQILLEHYGASNLPKIVVLTSDFHSWRARMTFEHLGLRAYTIPAPDLIKQSGFVLERWPAFLLLMDEFAKDFVYTVTGRI